MEYVLVEEGSGASVVVSPTTPSPGDDNPPERKAEGEPGRFSHVSVSLPSLEQR